MVVLHLKEDYFWGLTPAMLFNLFKVKAKTLGGDSEESEAKQNSSVPLLSDPQDFRNAIR